MPTTQKLTNEIITAAIEGFEGQKTRIDQQIIELRAILSGGATEITNTPEDAALGKRGGRRKFSAAARKRMAEAQKARWAAIKGTSEQPEAVTQEPTKAKRKMSAAGRKAIGDATRKRWAMKKAAEKAASKKATAKKAVKSAPVKATKKATAEKTTPAVSQAVV